MVDMLPENLPVALDIQDVELWNIYWGQLERRIASVFLRPDALIRLRCAEIRKVLWQVVVRGK